MKNWFRKQAPVRRDLRIEAEELFRSFAERHKFEIRRIEEPQMDLLLEVPSQPGLSFDIQLGLQNYDEINVGVGPFWSYFFPFDKVKGTVSEALDGLVSGECRIAIHRQWGQVARCVLERRQSGAFRPIYKDYRTVNLLKWPAPQNGKSEPDVSYISNSTAAG
jgi:hypothetical protein